MTATPSGPPTASGATAAPEPAPGGLRSRAAHGSLWTFLSFAIGNVLRLGSNLVLAHALFPEAFALVALAAIVLQALQMFSDVGVGALVIQHPRGREPSFLNTAWTVQVIRGVVLWLATLALAWPVARFYETPELVWVIPACGLAFISTGLQSTALYTCSRELKIGRITMMGLGESLIKTVITVVWALISPSVWALIGGSLISYVLFMIATHVMLPGERNRFAWDREAVRHLTRFGRWIFVSTALTFLAMQSDRLLLGKLVPMDLLGVYSIASMFARLPSEVVWRLTNEIQFPALSELARSAPERLTAKLLESRRVILALVQGGIVGVVIVSPWFFGYLYDDRYAAAAWLAPMLAGTVWFAILQGTADRALIALGDARTLALSNGVNCVITLSACLWGFLWLGMPGFIAGVGAGNVGGHLVVVVALWRRNIRIVRQDLAYTGFIVSVGGVALALPYLLHHRLNTPEHMALGAAALLVSAWWAYVVVSPLAWETARRVIPPRMLEWSPALVRRIERARG